MAFEIKPAKNHREREKGVLVYPVYSRRAGGLSIGINLFPAEKNCSFNCPYCEVFPFKTDAVFSLSQMEEDLQKAVSSAMEQNIPIKDICFSGNGEPTISPYFPGALKLAANIRKEIILYSGNPAANTAKLVLITNGEGLIDPQLFSLLLHAAAGTTALDIWLKLDAATVEWYEKINNSGVPFNVLINKIKEFTKTAAVTIQTMICAVDGQMPNTQEKREWKKLIMELANVQGKGGIRKVQIYGKARPAPEDPKALPAALKVLEERASSLHKSFLKANYAIPVEVYP